MCLPLGSIVEVFFNIDIDTYTPQTKLDELQNLTLKLKPLARTICRSKYLQVAFV